MITRGQVELLVIDAGVVRWRLFINFVTQNALSLTLETGVLVDFQNDGCVLISIFSIFRNFSF